MRIENLMTRNVKSCSPEDDLGVAARVMWENDCGCVPVVDAQSRVIAMITDRDVCMAAYTRGRRLEEMSVESARSQKLFSCRPTDDSKQAEEMMKKEQIRRLPVVDSDGKLVGLLSLNDLAREAATARGRRDAPTTDEVGATLASVCTHRVRTTKGNGLVPARQVSSAVLTIN
jgi:CBS-domain-containing membrane protein